MSRQRELQRHQRQLAETREIVSAMKAMAFIEVRRLGRTLDNQRRVVETMCAATADFLSFYPQTLPPPARQLCRIYLLIGSERGFCGNFNANLVRRLQQCLAEEPGESGSASTGVIGWGRKLCVKLEDHPQLLAALEGAALLDEVGERLLQLVNLLADLQADSAIALTVLYQDPQRKAVVVRQLLPPFESLRDAAEQFPHAPHLNLAPRTLLRELVEQYLFAALHEILHVSLMEENQLRMQHLEGAQRYLDEKLEALSRRGRQLRQEEITEEIEVILLNADSAPPPAGKTTPGGRPLMPDTLAWIVSGGLLMSAIAMVGGITVFMKPATLERILLPLVSLAAATLLGGAFFHMLPEGLESLAPLTAAAWLVTGFSAFLLLEQFLHWHHSHSAREERHQPVTYLILLGDGIHNFIGGLAIASTFLIDPRAGISAWIAAVAHEIPQELGDFGVLVHGGWSRRRALLWNVLSALTFPIGALVAYLLAQQFDVAWLMLFGAGNFVYIAASDLIPEIKQQAGLGSVAAHFGFFALGLVLMFVLACCFHL